MFKSKEDAIAALLSYAKGEIGYLEKETNADLDDKTANAGDQNFTKYGAYFGDNGPMAYWCDYFNDYCFCMVFGKSQASKMLGGLSGYTPTSAAYYKNIGTWHTDPQAGDQIFFRNSERIHHTGIVTSVDDNNVYTVEGNTSSGDQVIPNGGAVCAKSYPIGKWEIAGYGTPLYELAVEADKGYTVGWNQDTEGWWYADSSNSYYSSCFQLINRCWYYFDAQGYAVTGKHNINGQWYFFENLAGSPKECAMMITDEKGALHVGEFDS